MVYRLKDETRSSYQSPANCRCLADGHVHMLSSLFLFQFLSRVIVPRRSRLLAETAADVLAAAGSAAELPADPVGRP